MSDIGLIGTDWEQRIDFNALREDRLARAKEALSESDLDALFVLQTVDCRYLTGYRTHLRPVAAIGQPVTVLIDGEDPILFTGDHHWARETMTWMDPEQIQPRPYLRVREGIENWLDNLGEVTEGILPTEGKIGVDVYDPKVNEALNQALPKAEFVDGYEVLSRAKIIKTPDEAKCIRLANAITEAAMDAAIDFLEPGVKECEVLATAWKTMVDMGSEWTQCANIVASGPNSAPYRRFTSDRIIRKGDPVIIDIGACFNGYWGDFTRTYICGEDVEPTERQKELHQKSYDALWDACAAAEPGDTNIDICEAAGEENILGSSLGHGSGVNPWEPPFLTLNLRDNPTTLEPNMQMNIEPYAGEPGHGGFRLENNLFVTEEGPEVYTTYPFDARLVEDPHPMDPITGRIKT